MNNKIIQHPSYYIKIFKYYIMIIFILTLFQTFWGIIIFYLNYKFSLIIYLYFKKFLFINKWEQIYVLINIYSMYSVLHSFYILLACIMSYFLNSKNWFFSALYFNLFPLVGVLFGLIQIPFSIYLLIKLKNKEWETFFKNYDSFYTMKYP
jgi:hypothetical protein